MVYVLAATVGSSPLGADTADTLQYFLLMKAITGINFPSQSSLTLSDN